MQGTSSSRTGMGQQKSGGLGAGRFVELGTRPARLQLAQINAVIEGTDFALRTAVTGS